MNMRPVCLILLLALAASSSIAANVPNGLSPADWSGIRNAHDEARRAIVVRDDGTRAARNPAQGWNTCFDGRGFRVAPDSSDWHWGLTLRSYDVSGSPCVTLSKPATTSSEADRLTYRWDDTVQEWFVNSASGLLQGWTVSRNPSGDRPATISLTLAVSGGLRPRVSENTTSVSFETESGSSVLTYSGLKAWDADGQSVPVSFAALPDEPSTFSVRIDASRARFPVTIDPIAQQAYLKASNTAGGDHFGISVAISGDTVVVGAHGEDSNATGINGDEANDFAPDSGAAYVFARNGTNWTQQAYLKASNTGTGDNFGFSVAISGNTIVVGATGEDSLATDVGGDQFSNSAVNAGAVYVFVRSGSTWTQQAYVKASNTNGDDAFGFSVAISGNTIAVGALGEDSWAVGPGSDQADNSATDAGAAYIFVRNGIQWSQQAYLKASNTGPTDYFGGSIAISGDTVVIGAYQEDGNGTSENDNNATFAGAAYVFTRSGAAWGQQAYLKASSPGAGDFFGRAVAISENTVIVGAQLEKSAAQGVNGNESDDSATDAGAAYVFVRDVSTWNQQAYLKPSNTRSDLNFGVSVAISGDLAAVGAFRENSNTTGVDGNQADTSAASAGAAYLFQRTGTTWTQQNYLKASNTDASDWFGYAVALTSDTLVVSAWREDSNATGVNGSQADDSAGDSGAAYVFSIASPLPTVFAKGRTRLLTSRAKVVLRGTSNDATLVEYKAGKGGFKPAKGSPSAWKIPVRLTSTRTVVSVRATGPGGKSSLLKFKIHRK